MAARITFPVFFPSVQHSQHRMGAGRFEQAVPGTSGAFLCDQPAKGYGIGNMLHNLRRRGTPQRLVNQPPVAPEERVRNVLNILPSIFYLRTNGSFIGIVPLRDLFQYFVFHFFSLPLLEY